MELDRRLELAALHGLQSYESLDGLMTVFTGLGDPSFSMLYVFPLCVWFIPQAALSVLSALILSDLSNAWLKFPLAGDRPYWVDPTLRQFPMTCETGYGMPSGHVQVSTAVLCVVWTFIRQQHPQRSLLVGACMVTIVSCIAVSRLHTASHFPHQVVFGALIGIACGVVSKKWVTPVLTRKFLMRPTSQILKAAYVVSFASSLVVVSLLEYWFLLVVLGVDPLESTNKAATGCQIDGGVHATASPFQGVSRDAGIVCGAGLAAIGSKLRPKDLHITYQGFHIFRTTYHLSSAHDNHQEGGFKLFFSTASSVLLGNSRSQLTSCAFAWVGYGIWTFLSLRLPNQLRRHTSS